MAWFPVVIALLAILLVREFWLWWFSSMRSPLQIGSENTNRERIISDKVDQIRGEVEPRPPLSNTSQATSSSDTIPGNPHPSNVQEVRAVGQLATAATAHPGGNEPENSPAPGQVFMFPGAQGFFNHAHDIAFYQPVMCSINETKEKVLQWLAVFTMSDAEFDTRGHPPSCHPGTRIAILETLRSWINDTRRAHRMLWLHGPAGVGKSAIVQSLAEELAKSLKLGATLFFSRPNKRDNPSFVFPTIAYQLAVRIPRYKEYLRQKMIADPKLLEKEMTQQFNILIIEPFTDPSFAASCGTWAILLDGLDECSGEEAQALIITLISFLSLRYPTAPLVWLIASRPEAHLQYAFASSGVRGSFEERDVPANSDDACRDVERFLRTKFEEIHQKYKDLIPVGVPWPVEQDITRVSKASSGLFVLATTVVRYIEDPHVCDPISQLATVVSVTEGLEPGSLSALHAFYSAILIGVPQAMLPILKQLLLLYTVKKTSSIVNDNADTNNTKEDIPLVFAATLFGLQQHIVYGTLRRLHSVLKVPPPEESGSRGIKFYHASFPDYLKIVPGDYEYGSNHSGTKLWWGYFRMLYGGDSSSYQRATSGGRPPIKFSWDSSLADGFLDSIWEQGISSLTHDLMPECPEPGELGHIQVPLTAQELQDAFEKIDFSTLLFQRRHKILFSSLFDLFDWLVSDAPPELVESGIVKTIPLRDLDLNCIPEEKLAHEFLWTSRERKYVDGVEGPRQRQFYRKAIRRDSHHYTNAPPKSLRLDWHNKTRPSEKLILKLRQLQSDNSTTPVLVVGRGPFRRCAFVCVEPQSRKRGSFYYVPYEQ